MEEIVPANNNWNRFLGAFLGFLCLGGVFGAAVGYILVFLYEREDRRNDVWGNVNGDSLENVVSRQKHLTFMLGVIVLSAKMSRVDGTVSGTEIEAFKSVFNINPYAQDIVSRLFNQARATSEGFEPYARRLGEIFAGAPIVLEEILSGLFTIGASDAPLTPNEFAFLRKVSALFGFDAADFVRIAARSGIVLPEPEKPKHRPPEAFVILGLEETASDKEIKDTYRRLIREHHPDKLSARGVPEEFIVIATEKMKRINVAYDDICKIRGIK